MNYNQVSDVINSVVGVMSVEDKPTLVNMLQRSGSFVNDMSSQKELLDAAFSAIKESKRFRSDLQAYIVAQSVAGEESGEEKSFADDNYYSNSNGGTTTTTGATTTTAAKQKTTAGNIISSIFNTDNLTKAVGIGMDFFATKLQNQAASQGNKEAIAFQTAQAQAYANQALASQAAAAAAPSKSKKSKKWVVPVIIGGSVLLLGAILFIVLRKKN